MFGQLVAAGTTTGTVTRTDQSLGWMVMATTAVALTLVFDDRLTVTIPSTNTGFVEIVGNYQKMAVTGGTASYMVFG